MTISGGYNESGMTIQHGRDVVAATSSGTFSKTVSFPVPFAGTPDVVCTVNNSSNPQGYSYYVEGTVTNTGFTFSIYIPSGYGANVGFSWIAIYG